MWTVVVQSGVGTRSTDVWVTSAFAGKHSKSAQDQDVALGEALIYVQSSCGSRYSRQQLGVREARLCRYLKL